MIPYYTGASSPNAQQPNSNNSLGGYVSNSPVPNGSLNNVFGELTPSSPIQTRLIVFKNTVGDLSTLSFYLNDTDHIQYKTAAVSAAMDSCGNPIFEVIQADDHLPYQAVLALHPQNNPIQISNVDNDSFIGIWIRRELKNTNDVVYKALSNQELSCEEVVILQSIMENAIQETAVLQVDWTA